MDDLNVKKRARDNSSESPAPESDVDSPEVKRLRQDLLDLDDESEFCTTSQDLDSFMKTFEDEIAAGDATPVVDLTSDSGESRPDLGYLFEASDDDLGLPPTLETELVDELWEIPSYDSFGFGFGESEVCNGGDYVALDGLFDHSDVGFGSSEFLLRPETLPAQ